jgi:hypothetical protein
MIGYIFPVIISHFTAFCQLSCACMRRRKRAGNSCPFNRIPLTSRDQHALCLLHRLPVGPLTLTTTPVPLCKSRARHDLKFTGPHKQRASVCGRRAALRSGSVPLDASSPPCAPLSRPPSADRSHVRCQSLLLTLRRLYPTTNPL